MQGSFKEKVEKAANCNTETNIVVATPSQMVFPHNEAVVNATHKKGRKNLLLLLLVPRRARGQLPLLL